jgi:nicotinamidase-related amidase
MPPNWRGLLDQWPLPIPAFDLDPESTALLVIDMQRFCADMNYGLGRKLTMAFPDLAARYAGRLPQVVANVRRLIESFRAHRRRVIYTTFGPETPDGSDLPWFRKRTDASGRRSYNNFPRGTPEHDILPEIKPLSGELVVNKTTTSPFTSTGIDQTLRHMGVSGLVIAGLSTDACVEGTARDAADHGFRCVVVADACAALEESAHDASLATFARLFGRVATTDEILTELAGTV